jgi:short-subunit dehydrogenase
MDPSGKTVIITGASAGIGAATAQACAAAGAHVVLAARDATRLETVRRSLPGRHLAVVTDMSERAQVAALVAQAHAVFGSIDIVISNAGVGLAAPVGDMQASDLEAALGVNLFGPLALAQIALAHMRRQGRGQLIFVSSVVGLRALPFLGGYAASKAALDRLTESLRVELLGSGIAVTLVRPGSTRTGFSGHRLGRGHERRRTPTRAATPEQVARAIIRAARDEPRVAYVSTRDKLIAWAGVLLPSLADRLLARSFAWQPPEDSLSVNVRKEQGRGAKLTPPAGGAPLKD